jgi:phospholipid transport system substrate-binding protein
VESNFLKVCQRPFGRLLVVASVPLLFAGGLPSNQSHGPVTPTQHVAAVIDEALAYLRAEDLDRSAVRAGIDAVIDRHFDFRTMSQSVLSAHWHTASPEEQRGFVQYFSDYLGVIYRTKIEAYTNQRIEYLSEKIRGDRAKVDIAIVSDTGRTPVSFRLRDNEGEWLAYDVVIDGISLVKNYKAMFDAIIKAEGMDGLQRDIEARIAAYKESHRINED